mmetsp:Transcript_9692/g.18646  ORF Transcript_9692/g.18646 Transcript_9692/m.18646 type:complete len:367 (-) Transcript_9692:92-1192(-)|eukprot:CAMPEP_0172809144 /NCGR_PEP_ID=MMETSP1075-20121228/8074_1 /TAXON_ID=2916 /ORGANISM="Ceratium fusus, Strain PA161109" /LENGTH=366 /DNA_ID=CAMNT_0013648345 /DNA_START=39 /DNA_END=1139 /DNA_ORIENTATION=+
MTIQESPMDAASNAVTWPVPQALEGVKSRKRPIFAVSSASLAVAGEAVSQISGLKINLESRIAAVGEAGRAAVELLLGECQLTRGRPCRHDRLRAARLGPPPQSSDFGFNSDTIATAIADVLEQRPQVVILEERPDAGEAWQTALLDILDGPQVRSFRGAVITSVQSLESKVGRAALALCHERWLGADGWLWQESVGADSLEVWEDVLGEGGLFKDNPRLDKLLPEVAETASHFFKEDAVAKSLEHGWKLSLLIDKDAEEGAEFCGYMCHRPPRDGKNALHIARLAVPVKRHYGGYGQHLMLWILRKAARMPQSECAWISLSSLDSAMDFYERFGFVDMTCDDQTDPEHFQTWMEMQNRSVVAEAE